MFFCFFFGVGRRVARWRSRLARTQRWVGGGRGARAVCPRRQMAWGAGPWWAGAGQAPCAVVGNWGPERNVGGTLILSATVVLRHRSPLPPPICSFHCSYGKCSCTHMHAHKNIHRHSLTHTYLHVSDCLVLIYRFGFSCSLAAALPHHVSSPSHKISLQAWLYLILKC